MTGFVPLQGRCESEMRQRLGDHAVIAALERDIQDMVSACISSESEDSVGCTDIHAKFAGGLKLRLAARAINRADYYKYRKADRELSITIDNGRGEEKGEAAKLLAGQHPDFFVQYLEDETGELCESLWVHGRYLAEAGRLGLWKGRVKSRWSPHNGKGTFQLIDIDHICAKSSIPDEVLVPLCGVQAGR